MMRVELQKRYREMLRRWNMRPSHAILSAGSALVMYGIRKATSDLDVDVDDAVFEKARADPDSVVEDFGGNTIVNVAEDISFHRHATSPSERIVVNGIGVYCLEALLKQKRSLLENPARNPDKLESDREDILAIERILKLNRAF